MKGGLVEKHRTEQSMRTRALEEDHPLRKVMESKFSMEKVAEMIGVHVSTVSRLMDSSQLGYYQIGRRRIVGESHTEQYLRLVERKAQLKENH